MIVLAKSWPSIDIAISEIINLLKNSRPYIRQVGADTLSKYSEQSKIVNLSCLALLMRIIAQFQPFIVTAIPKIVALLQDSDTNVSMACITALSKFSEQGMMVSLSGLALLMRIIAQFWPFIVTAIPKIVALLQGSDTDVCMACATALSKFSEQGMMVNLSGLALLMRIVGEFWPSIVTAIPKIVALLQDSDTNVSMACATALSKFSEQGKIVKLSGLALLMRIVAEFWALIKLTILDIVKSLNNGNFSNVWVAYLDVLSKLLQQGRTSTDS